MTPDEEQEVLHLMREARARSRGYADFFGWAIDRDLEEFGVVRSLAEAMAASGNEHDSPRNLLLRGRGSDPPDVEGTDGAGGRVAYEATELVDGQRYGPSRPALITNTPFGIAQNS